MKTFQYFFHKYPLIFVFAGFAIVNVIFNGNIFWKQIIDDGSLRGAVWGEVRVFEWLTDTFYKTLMRGENPFGVVKNMLYPFGIQLGLTDAGNGFFFVFLRPFFSMHQSMAIIVTLSLFFANIGMFLLLRRFGIGIIPSFLTGLAYGYMTFLMPRGGHLNYWCIYVFPWFYLSIMQLIQARSSLQKHTSYAGISFFFVLTLWINFYYFIMLLISLASFGLYFLVLHRSIFLQKIVELWRDIFAVIILIFILLIPWAQALYETVFFDVVPKTTGWGGAIQFSSDLFGYFIPSIYSSSLHSVAGFLGTRFAFARNIFEQFSYPGIIILSIYFSFAVLLWKKKLPAKFRSIIFPFFVASTVFWVLTLGPFLHVFGKWGLTVDEGIRIVVPLPYILLHYIPLLENIRVPGRLIVGFIFFAYIVTGFLLDFFLKKKSRKFLFIFSMTFLLVFFIDNRYVNNISPPSFVYPYKIFEEIKKDPEKVTVLEIPFTVRDGFTYFGDGNAVLNIEGESYHGKPVVGGYTGRIADYKKNYYRHNPLFGYLGRVIDVSLMGNPSIDKEDLTRWRTMDVRLGKEVADFLDMKYLITEDKRPYMATLSAQLKELGYREKMEDDGYSLWEKNLEKKEFLRMQMGNPGDVIFLGMGWHLPEGDFRWSEKKSSVMFKILKKRPLHVEFSIEPFVSDQKMSVYLNKKKIGTVIGKKGKNDYSLPVSKEILKDGINTVHFISDTAYRPIDVMPENLDTRELTNKFYSVDIKDASL